MFAQTGNELNAIVFTASNLSTCLVSPVKLICSATAALAPIQMATPKSVKLQLCVYKHRFSFLGQTRGYMYTCRVKFECDRMCENCEDDAAHGHEEHK